LSEQDDISFLFDEQHARANISQGDGCSLLRQGSMENKEKMIDSFLQDIRTPSSSHLAGDFLELNDLTSERKIIELELGWEFMQKGITKLKNILEGIPE